MDLFCSYVVTSCGNEMLSVTTVVLSRSLRATNRVFCVFFFSIENDFIKAFVWELGMDLPACVRSLVVIDF